MKIHEFVDWNFFHLILNKHFVNIEEKSYLMLLEKRFQYPIRYAREFDKKKIY